MRKEVIIAILIGLGMGLIITYGVYKSRTSISTPDTKPAVVAPSPTPIGGNSQNLSLISPEDEIIQSDTKLTVTGSTSPNNFVVIFINDTETITNADESGNFSVEVTLEKDTNIINIQTINEDGETTTIERTVIVYPDGWEDETRPSQEDNSEASDSADTKDEEDTKNE